MKAVETTSHSHNWKASTSYHHHDGPNFFLYSSDGEEIYRLKPMVCKYHKLYSDVEILKTQGGIQF